jgi:transcriptional regulator PpsR
MVAVDGTKFRADNSKKNNFNIKKIDRHKKYIDEKIEEYMNCLDENDKNEENDQMNDPGAVGEDSDPGLAELIEALPDGFVVTDADHRILSANMAFVELAQMVDAKQIRNEPLYRWLGRSPVDFRVMLKAIGGDGRIRNYPTVLQGELGSRDDVIVSIVRKDIGRDARHAVIVRPVGEAERAGQAEASAPALDRSVEQLADLVGRVPMKDIVRDTTDLIERMCIEAALERTGDNRASAADILGLSRQSLYVKLRRFGMGSGDTD